MKDFEFPVFKTKSPAGSPVFDPNDPKGRAAYFQFKAGAEIAKLRQYLKKGTFLAIMLGKKGSGKGTYSKLFAEALNLPNIAHVSVGDLVRAADEEVNDPKNLKTLISFLEKNYRGWLPLEKIIDSQKKRSTKTLLPTEYILALIKREIGKLSGKAIFLDGFPRDLDQISYSLFFRDLIGFRDDPDFFVLIDIPEAVIDARIRSRVVCPKCHTPRNPKLFPTKKIEYDVKNKAFHLVCDNPDCRRERMVAKEGDELGIVPIKHRLDKDEELIKRAFDLYGVPKILLRNSVPVAQAGKMVDDYEITPEYVFHWDARQKRVKVEEKPWVFEDDRGVESVSLLAPPVTVALIKQLADLL